MLRLHYAPMTRCIRVRWLFEELELPYELIRGELVPPTEGYSQDTPSGKFPVLEDDEQVIAESGAIVEYVVERYGNGRLAPAVGDPLRGRYLEWLHYCEATAGSAMSPVIFHTRYVEDAEERGDLVEVWTRRARAALQPAEVHLTDRAFLLDDEFTAADIMLGYTVAVAQVMNILGDDFPTLKAYFGRLSARPAFGRAMAD
jgi:glutathione S-transferase